VYHLWIWCTVWSRRRETMGSAWLKRRWRMSSNGLLLVALLVVFVMLNAPCWLERAASACSLLGEGSGARPLDGCGAPAARWRAHLEQSSKAGQLKAPGQFCASAKLDCWS